jgi:hypothetical protein
MTAIDESRVGSSVLDEPTSTIASDGRSTGRSGPRGGRRARHGLRPALISGGIYLALAVVVWWHVWTGHPTSTTTCGCGDSSLFTWFLEWPAYAISHGLNPLYSSAMFHPAGVNLLSNTAEVGIGVVLAPVTWLFGPVATLNVALTLSPFLSALAMYILLRRWVSWAPAAFAGGLLYGFSPFVLLSLTDAHLMLGMAFVPPLLVACLDEALVRQRRRPVVVGLLIGLLVTAQFLIGSEILAIVAIGAAVGVVLVLLYGLRHPEPVRPRVRYAVVALGAAAITSIVLLAYPVWFAFAGPAHLGGPVWGPHSVISYGGNPFNSYFLPASPDAMATSLDLHFGGYQAPLMSGQYFGFGLIVVLIVGVLLWRRDRRLWLFGLVGVVAVLLSMALHQNYWTLWRLFVLLPMMDNIIPSRFLVVTYLAAAVMLGIILDHVYAGASRWRATQTARHRIGTRPGVQSKPRFVGALAGGVVAVVALAPIAAYYTAYLPLTATPVVLPTWFRTVAPHLNSRQVVLAFPVPFAFYQSAMTWQAVDRMHYTMVGGGGPNAMTSRAGKEAPGQVVIGNISVSDGAPEPITPKQITAVRDALDGWGVTTVVVPDQAGLPLYERVHLVRSIAVLMTAATGQRPVRQAGAWVWTGVQHAGPAVLPSAAALAHCSAGPAGGTPTSIEQSTDCVLSSSSGTR